MQWKSVGTRGGRRGAESCALNVEVPDEKTGDQKEFYEIKGLRNTQYRRIQLSATIIGYE